MSKLEKHEESKLVKWARANDIIAIKFTPLGEKGWPDRIFIMPTGVHVWIELKRKGKKPEPIQYHRMDQLRLRQCEVHWCDSAEKAITILKRYRYEKMDAT